MVVWKEYGDNEQGRASIVWPNRYEYPAVVAKTQRWKDENQVRIRVPREKIKNDKKEEGERFPRLAHKCAVPAGHSFPSAESGLRSPRAR